MAGDACAPAGLEPLEQLIRSGEDWLIRQVLDHARRHDYTRFTSTLEEAWRLSVRGLSDSLIQALRAGPEPPERCHE
ncbi:MAG: hypothetical protein HY815_23370 [Candidatus Riflebacteria bacterium]|nr:hypothetical protein [Candidatus Riflebacteria bacterium]